MYLNDEHHTHHNEVAVLLEEGELGSTDDAISSIESDRLGTLRHHLQEEAVVVHSRNLIRLVAVVRVYSKRNLRHTSASHVHRYPWKK